MFFSRLGQIFKLLYIIFGLLRNWVQKKRAIQVRFFKRFYFPTNCDNMAVAMLK